MASTSGPAPGTMTAPRERWGPAMGFVLSHEQFPAPRLVEYGEAFATRASRRAPSRARAR